MTSFKSNPQFLNAKLTALWAVSESGLGGLLHAIKVPFSGLFLGSFAIIIITYLAQNNRSQIAATLFKATAMVVLIKAMASPHSPPMAYVAVVFQGTLGALIYGVFGLHRLSAMGFGALALLESAFQKIVTLTLLFGMGLWDSILLFFEGLEAKLQLQWIQDLPWVFLSVYGLVYLVVGLIAGKFAYHLPKMVVQNLKQMKNVKVAPEPIAPTVKRKKRKRIGLIAGLLGFAVLVFLISGMTNKALYLILRTFGAIIVFLFVFNPLFKYGMQKWMQRKKSRNHEQVATILELMPQIKNHVSVAQQLARSENGIYNRGKAFIIHWLSLSLHLEDEA